jgi:hypothetical protein
VLIIGRGSKNQAAHLDDRATQVKVPQIAALQELRVDVLVAVMELQIVARVEAVRCPKVQAAAFAANGIADNLPIIGVSAQITSIKYATPTPPRLVYRYKYPRRANRLSGAPGTRGA